MRPIARVGDRITEPGSKVSSEERKVPDLDCTRKRGMNGEGSHMACTSKREADLF